MEGSKLSKYVEKYKNCSNKGKKREYLRKMFFYGGGDPTDLYFGIPQELKELFDNSRGMTIAENDDTSLDNFLKKLNDNNLEITFRNGIIESTKDKLKSFTQRNFRIQKKSAQNVQESESTVSMSGPRRLGDVDQQSRGSTTTTDIAVVPTSQEQIINLDGNIADPCRVFEGKEYICDEHDTYVEIDNGFGTLAQYKTIFDTGNEAKTMISESYCRSRGIRMRDVLASGNQIMLFNNIMEVMGMDSEIIQEELNENQTRQERRVGVVDFAAMTRESVVKRIQRLENARYRIKTVGELKSKIENLNLRDKLNSDYVRTILMRGSTDINEKSAKDRIMESIGIIGAVGVGGGKTIFIKECDINFKIKGIPGSFKIKAMCTEENTDHMLLCYDHIKVLGIIGIKIGINHPVLHDRHKKIIDLKDILKKNRNKFLIYANVLYKLQIGTGGSEREEGEIIAEIDKLNRDIIELEKKILIAIKPISAQYIEPRCNVCGNISQ
jgi:hypothetical protein